MVAMEPKGPFRIDGITYSHAELLGQCRHSIEGAVAPRWYRDVFSFIWQFLDQGKGPIRQRSSGTTGDPKWFDLEREAMILSATRTLRFFNLKPGDRAMLCLPMDYVAGKMMVVRGLVGGLDLVLVEPSGRPLESTTGKFDFAAMVPLQVRGSLKAGDDLSGIRQLLVGGGELHPSIRADLSVMELPAVYESFAMTETYSHFALRRINGPFPDSGFRPMEGVKIGKDERGCLVVEMPGLSNGPVVTNDLVEMDVQGSCFNWLGRIDNVINSGGIKVIPEILEQRIRELLGLECLLLGEQDEKLGQKLVLLVEYTGLRPPVDRWFELLRHRLKEHEVPKIIDPVREIPRNAAYKPDRGAARQLRSRY
jgi:O-succinylbenzoic acid--CoA ligase